MTNQSIEGYLIFRDTQLDSGRTVRPLVPLVPLVPSKGPQVTPGTIVPRCSTCIAKRQRTSAVDLSWSIVIPSFFRGGTSAATRAPRLKGLSSWRHARYPMPHPISHRELQGIVGLQLPATSSKKGTLQCLTKQRDHSHAYTSLLEACQILTASGREKDGCCAQTVLADATMITMFQWEFQDPKMEVLCHISGHILWWYSLT